MLTINLLMKKDLTQRFAFLVNDVSRLYGRRFDQLAMQQIGLSRAQCRLIGVLAAEGGPLPQAVLAERMDLSAMAVASLCDRMEAGGWIRRAASTSDRRVKEIHLEPPAEEALAGALAVSDGIQARVLGGFTAAERTQLLQLLRRAHANLVALSSEPPTP